MIICTDKLGFIFLSQFLQAFWHPRNTVHCIMNDRLQSFFCKRNATLCLETKLITISPHLAVMSKTFYLEERGFNTTTIHWQHLMLKNVFPSKSSK